jgi:GGDEF domain-containing protein
MAAPLHLRRRVDAPARRRRSRHPVMLSLSSTVIPLLDVLQFRCGVALEVLDASLRSVHPERSRDFAGVTQEPGVREACLAVLKSGEGRIDRSLLQPLGIYPLRRDREIVGLLLVARRGQDAASLVAADESVHLEAAGQLARAVLENDLVVSAKLAQTTDRTRRLQGILRFITQLAARDGEREMMHAVVQAATVWFDLDCRVYHVDPDDSYRLFAALPGLDRSKLETRLDGARARDMAATHRLSSVADLEMVDWPGRRGEVLVFSIGERPDWIIMLAGVLEPEVELTFSAVAHVISGELTTAARLRRERWQRRLSALTSEGQTAPDPLLLTLIQEVAIPARADGARVTLEQVAGERTLAAYRASPDAEDEPVAEAVPTSYVRRIQIAPDAHVRIQLWKRVEPFDYEDLAQVDGWIEVVGPWLCGAAAGLLRTGTVGPAVDHLDFEHRIQDEVERAKRFNLGLGLVVIDVEGRAANQNVVRTEAVLDAVRPQLRASDLVGHVRGGVAAVLLVHTGSEGAHSVTDRLRQRLGETVGDTYRTTIRVGQAVFSAQCQTGDALVQQALQRREELSLS